MRKFSVGLWWHFKVMEKDKPSKFYSNNRLATSQINMLVLITYFYTKINSRWIKDLEVFYEAMKIIEENVNNYFYNLGLKEASLN